MVIEIKKSVTEAKLKKVLPTAGGIKKKSLRKHFGKLKRGLNGLDYQKKVRREWN